MNPIMLCINGLVVIRDLFDTIDEVNRLRQRPTRTGRVENIEKASLASRIALLGFSITETALLISGSGSKPLANVKAGETLVRLLRVPLKYDQSGEILEPALEAFGTFSQFLCYQSDHCLSMSENDKSLFKKSSKINKDLSEEDLKSLLYQAKAAAFASIVYTTCKRLHIAEILVDNFYRRLYLYLLSTADQGAIEGSDSDSSVEVSEASVTSSDSNSDSSAEVSESSRTSSDEDSGMDIGEALYESDWESSSSDDEEGAPEETPFQGIDLLRLNLIPLPLHDDVILRQYICAITQSPARDPVADPTLDDFRRIPPEQYTLYERSAITDWINTCIANGREPTSPLTRRPLNVSDLVEVPLARMAIESRLSHHQEEMWRYINESPAFLAALRREEGGLE